MDDLIRQMLEGKKTVILGFGREGQSTYQRIRKVLPGQLLTVADINDSIAGSPLLKDDRNILLVTGKHYLDSLHQYDTVIKSPGISLHGVKEKIKIEKITSQTDLFLRRYSKQVIGITGTKGKSTTASMLSHVLRTAGKDVVLVGNIGRPAFNYVDDIRPETIIVFELSSHQLEYLAIAPHIAILLNLFQEHLDAYISFRDYCLAKWNITKCQSEGDYFIYNADDPIINNLMQEFGIKRNFRAFSSGTGLPEGYNTHLKGSHNLKNIMAVITACKILGLADEDIVDGVAGFRGLEHRLEFAGNYHGIDFYDDSISTIPESCIEAVKALETVDTLILGGFDRGVDYSGLIAFLKGSSVTNLIFTGDAGKNMYAGMKDSGKRCFLINKFDEFIDIALKYTTPGMICLLSPAAASYDEFVNFEERGKRFRELAS